MGRNIALYANELADAYALKTLYDEIKPLFKDDNIYFINRPESGYIADIIGREWIGGQHALYHSNPDLVLMNYSDVLEDLCRYEYGPYRTLAVDAAILKAAKPLINEAEKESIKIKHRLEHASNPITVIGRVPYDERGGHQELIKALLPLSQVVTVAYSDTGIKNYYLNRLTKPERDQVIDVEGRGHLSKLYAVADIAISGTNLEKYTIQLSNFFEQTQNGPVFMVLPEYTKQYGFKSFIDSGMIVPCNDVKEISRKVNTYLRKMTPEIKSIHKTNREHFTEETRKQELPKIIKALHQILESGNDKKIFRYQHPESEWRMHYYQSKNFVDIY